MIELKRLVPPSSALVILLPLGGPGGRDETIASSPTPTLRLSDVQLVVPFFVSLGFLSSTVPSYEKLSGQCLCQSDHLGMP